MRSVVYFIIVAIIVTLSMFAPAPVFTPSIGDPPSKAYGVWLPFVSR